MLYISRLNIIKSCNYQLRENLINVFIYKFIVFLKLYN